MSEAAIVNASPVSYLSRASRKTVLLRAIDCFMLPIDCAPRSSGAGADPSPQASTARSRAPERR